LLFNRALSQYSLRLSTFYIKFAIGHDREQIIPLVIPRFISPRYNSVLVTQLLNPYSRGPFLGGFLINVL
jgi:hypothetical protein